MVRCLNPSFTSTERKQEGGHTAIMPFVFDATEYLKEGENTIIVHLNNREESSRWYPGAGLFRPVKLVLMPRLHIDPWDVYIRTTRLDEEGATLSVDAKIDGWDGKEKLIAIAYESKDGPMEKTALTIDPLTGIAHAEINWKKGKYSVWTPEHPALIHLVSTPETRVDWLSFTPRRLLSAPFPSQRKRAFSLMVSAEKYKVYACITTSDHSELPKTKPH